MDLDISESFQRGICVEERVFLLGVESEDNGSGKKMAAHVRGKIPESSELSNMVANDTKVAKLVTNLVAKNDANLALPPIFRQVLIELPL
ncbi:hypothetical protein TNCV_4746151 [Trichonephila clavipes]|nr:hypothetical protein TNCV_4746151 [Trichonephila clavipes]